MRIRQSWLAYMSRADSIFLPHLRNYSARDKLSSLYRPSNLSQKGQPVGHPIMKISNLNGGAVIK